MIPTESPFELFLDIAAFIFAGAAVYYVVRIRKHWSNLRMLLLSPIALYRYFLIPACMVLGLIVTDIVLDYALPASVEFYEEFIEESKEYSFDIAIMLWAASALFTARRVYLQLLHPAKDSTRASVRKDFEEFMNARDKLDERQFRDENK